MYLKRLKLQACSPHLLKETLSYLSKLITAIVRMEAAPAIILVAPLNWHNASPKAHRRSRIVTTEKGNSNTATERSTTARLAMNMFATRTLGRLLWRKVTISTIRFPRTIRVIIKMITLAWRAVFKLLAFESEQFFSITKLSFCSKLIVSWCELFRNSFLPDTRDVL